MHNGQPCTHSHNHGHAHGHAHGAANMGRAFAVGVALNLGFVLVESAYGFLANSLALLADAGHNLSDVFGLLLAWAGATLSRSAPTERMTYGLKRSSILAALFNGLLLLVAVGAIIWEAIKRFLSPELPETGIVIVVALIGIVINTATALMFVSGRKDDINVKAAFIHMAGDAAISLGVVLGGILIWYTGYLWIDPALSIMIALMIIWSTWGLLKDALRLSLDAVPDRINPNDVKDFLSSLTGILKVHDLHIWGISTTDIALTAHLVRNNSSEDDRILSEAVNGLKDRFGIGHATLQLESADFAAQCGLAPDDVV